MLCFAQTWQFVQCWCTDFFMPFQCYLFFSDAYVLLSPLCPYLSCAKMMRQSFRMSGTTMGVYKSPFSTSFHLRMLFSMVYMFQSKFLFSHCFLSWLVCGSLSCSFTNFSSFKGECRYLLPLGLCVECLCCLFHFLSLPLLLELSLVVVPQKGSSQIFYPLLPVEV